MLLGPAPVAADAVREETFLSASFSMLFSISIEPLKYAPSSMMICAVVKSPFTEPSFLISILPFPRTLPFTLPYTITSPAMMSAVNFAVAPTVSFRSSRWTSETHGAPFLGKRITNRGEDGRRCHGLPCHREGESKEEVWP